MKLRLFITIMLAAILLFAMTACDKKQTSTTSNPTVQQTNQNDSTTSADKDSSTHKNEASESKSDTADSDETSSSNSDEASADDEWKVELEKRLFEEYGLIPEYYEDLGNGIYQVYVEIDGNVIPFVTVDSATGDYHG